MTAPELRAKVRKTLGYPDSYQGLEDSDINALMDEAMANLASIVLPARLRGSVSVPVVAGQDSYIVTGAARVFAVNLDGAKFLQPYTMTRLEREAPYWSGESGTPDKYWMEGVEEATGSMQIRIHPKPSVDGSLVVTTVKQPRVLDSYAGGEVGQWDELGQSALVFYACWRHGCNANVIVDPAKMQLWFDGYARFQDMLRSYEDPTSPQAQEAMVEQGWRRPNQ